MKIFGTAIAVVAMAFAGSAANAQTQSLTSVEITKIVSTSVPAGETIAAGAFSTTQDHNGTLKITVREIGYAKSTRINKLNGVVVSNTAISDVPVTSGSTVIGFDRTYQITANSGTFTTTSTNSYTPFNQITDQIIIK